jgi:hypothetical protein
LPPRPDELGLEIEFHQSNREYEIIDWIHGCRERVAGIVINPAAFIRTSVAVLDALNAFAGRSSKCIFPMCTSASLSVIIPICRASLRPSSSAAERRAMPSPLQRIAKLIG